jgi:hypothetical protein
MAQFEEACRKGGSGSSPYRRTPKLNGHMERAHRTRVDEFWERYDGDWA